MATLRIELESSLPKGAKEQIITHCNHAFLRKQIEKGYKYATGPIERKIVKRKEVLYFDLVFWDLEEYELAREKLLKPIEASLRGIGTRLFTLKATSI